MGTSMRGVHHYVVLHANDLVHYFNQVSTVLLGRRISHPIMQNKPSSGRVNK